MQKIAYGFLKLQPHEFWRLTPKEYQLMVEGYKEYDYTIMQKVAQLASWVTAPHLKRPIPPEKLLGKKDENKGKKRTTPEETKNYLDELEAEFR